MFDVCDWCSITDPGERDRAHELREHCAEGKHCHQTDAACSAEWTHSDHPRNCHICGQPQPTYYETWGDD